MDASNLYEDTESIKEFLCLLDEQRENGEFCDVILIADGIEFPAHKFILSCASPYFKSMFKPKSGFLESEIERIEIKNIESEALRQIIEFSYKRKINITNENYQSLFATSHLLQYNQIIKMCIAVIRQMMDIKYVEHCFDIFHIAQLYEEIDLLASVSAFIGNHFNSIIMEQIFLDLNYDQLVYILNRTEIVFNNETHIFRGIINWIEEQKIEREKHFIDLIKFLKMENLSMNYLINNVSNHLLIQNMECYKMILDAYKFNFNFISSEIRSKDSLIITYAKNLPKDIKLPTLRTEFEFIVLDNKIYILGGLINKEPTDIVDMYDPRTNCWNSMCPMLNKRTNPKSEILNGKIYVVGGSKEPMNVEEYDPKINRWKLVHGRKFHLVYALLDQSEYLDVIYNDYNFINSNTKKMSISYYPVSLKWDNIEQCTTTYLDKKPQFIKIRQ